MTIYSSKDELEKIRLTLSRFIKLPFAADSIPGAIMESVLAHVRGGEVLRTYDFVDVINRGDQIGWQVKSTKAATPVTWKRAKIPNAASLIEESRKSKQGLQNLGNAIIEFCNSHAQESLELYNLDQIGFARLIIHKDGRVTYYERVLCTREEPQVFNANDFEWNWSKQKKTKKKEQLSALHGTHTDLGKKWWAWHGLGENQLHFSGENAWWPTEIGSHTMSFELLGAQEKMTMDEFVELLEKLDG